MIHTEKKYNPCGFRYFCTTFVIACIFYKLIIVWFNIYCVTSKRLQIAVNTRLLLPGKLEGLGVFTHETLKRIVKKHPEADFHFFFDRPWSEQFIYAENVIPHILFPQARHPFLYYLWFEWSVAARLKKIRADIFVSPDGYLSLRSPVKQLPVIHDLNFHYFPEYFDYFHKKHYLHYFPLYAAKGTRIATVSEFSASDIVKWYGTRRDKIDVVWNGVDEASYFPVDDAVKTATREKYTGGQPYFFFIGGLYPRKNLVKLVEAFEKFRDRHTGVKLVLAGSPNRFSEALLEKAGEGKYKEDILLPGRIEPVSEVRNLMAASLALTYVSTFEGFGIPVIEAQRCGTAVITANNTSLPEVAGDAALLADHTSAEDIALKMEMIWTDPALRLSLVEKGMVNSQRFSWDRTAALLWSSIEKTVGNA